MKSLKEKTFKFYSDPGHGWLAVKLNDLIELGIGNKITPYSYYKGNTVYLEEDVDATTFCEAYAVKFGQQPRFIQKYCSSNSPCRGYCQYSVSLVAPQIVLNSLV